jgi:Transposase DDE domain
VHDAGRVGTAEALARLAGFRRDVYDSFVRWPDGLFEVVDALAGADRPVRSIAELTLESVGARGWGSFYQALNHGVIDVPMVRDVLVGQIRPAAPVGPHGVRWPLMFAVDTSVVPRPDTTVVADVGMQYTDRGANRAAVVTPGWAMSWLCQVGELSPAGTRTSWVLPVDVRRVPTGSTPTAVAIAQVGDLAAALARTGLSDPGGSTPPLVLFDAAYAQAALTQHLPDRVQILVRLRGNQVLRARPAARPAGARGRPPLHGPRFALKQPHTWGLPQAQHTHHTPDGATVHTQAWHHLHPKTCNGAREPWQGIIEGTIIRQETHHPDHPPQVRWLWWAGPADAFDLAMLARAYPHRFTIEHGFRFYKQDLFWTGHTPLDPDQAERWAWIVALAYTQLHLARPLVADQPRRWHKPQPVHRLSPRRVRRDFRRVCATLPSPTNPPKTHKPGPGRPKGSPNKTRRPRHPVHVKGKPAPTGRKPGRPRKNPPPP